MRCNDKRRSTGTARGSSASRERSATRNTLVVVQVALAVVLVVSAALMIRTFQALRDVDPGFCGSGDDSNREDLDSARACLADQAQITRIQREMLDNIAALPGVVQPVSRVTFRWTRPGTTDR